MSAAQVDVNRDSFGHVYMWSLVIAGAAIVLGSLYELQFTQFDAAFVFLCLMVMASSIVAIKIPRVSGRITVADTFIFLAMLLYGGAAAILLSGSGPQDRDEAMLEHKPFAVIADHLTRNGIAVLRFDDRGTAQSTGDYATATSPDHASDANAAFAWLAARPEIRSDAIGFIGHSEGGITGPTAMASNGDVAYLVSMAGPGTSLVDLLLSQRRLLTTQMGLSQADIDRQEPVMRALFEATAAADTPQAGYDAAMAVMTPEAKTALGMPVEMDAALVVRQVSTPWLQYLLKYDPAPNLARIDVPVLALNGSLDLQVPPRENLAVIREALSENPDVTVVELPGLNHLFQHATTGSIGEYRDIEETFDPATLALISGWIRERFVEE